MTAGPFSLSDQEDMRRLRCQSPAHLAVGHVWHRVRGAYSFKHRKGHMCFIIQQWNALHYGANIVEIPAYNIR